MCRQTGTEQTAPTFFTVPPLLFVIGVFCFPKLFVSCGLWLFISWQLCGFVSSSTLRWFFFFFLFYFYFFFSDSSFALLQRLCIINRSDSARQTIQHTHTHEREKKKKKKRINTRANDATYRTAALHCTSAWSPNASRKLFGGGTSSSRLVSLFLSGFRTVAGVTHTLNSTTTTTTTTKWRRDGQMPRERERGNSSPVKTPHIICKSFAVNF